ncbi:hypothetical protein KN246_16715 [Mycobacterium intracellulare]|nr:hypothetical protein [Mycobacterium intracellulare]UGT95018.1 hypothetical protein LTQ55_14635 [Mycobacterium intracellulare]UGU09111.1 hypothetical protein LTQ56_11055 [Mycobacterium intracellulare subsp. intracellulare]UQB95892.1 hypothetical protein KN246_16715 [Mycobacterium intracellulare]UQC05806.1 hypothetical protein KN251_16545 [Mycobacterium intracellulare ATCC 13950]
MLNTTIEEQRMPLRQALISSLVVVAVLLGGCAPVLHKPHAAGSTNPYEDTAHPMSDDQTKAQVIEPAKQIVAAAKLEGVSGAFSFASCNDQGDPPFQGTVTLSFLIHGDPDAYFQQVRAAMIAQGWNEGAPPGQHYHGASLNKDGVAASISYMPSDHAYGQIIFDGQCRNMGNHKGEGQWTNINDQLAAR